MLKIRDLTIFDHASPILQSVSLEVKRGEIVALIGPNGSGKSALIRAAAGGYAHFDGEIKIGSYNLGRQADKAKSQLGFAASNIRFETFLTGLEWLEIVGAAYAVAPKVRIGRILELADQLGIKEELYTLGERLSLPDIQKISIIASLLHQPVVALWDEPTLGLDSIGRDQLTALAERYASDSGALLAATNDLDWAESIATHFIFMNEGEIVAHGTQAQLRSIAGSSERSLKAVFAELAHER